MMLSVVIEKEGFRYPLTFIIARARSDSINAPAVAFGLRVTLRITVNFGSGGLKYSCTGSFCKTKSIESSVYRGFGGIYRILLVPQGAGGTCKIVYLVTFDIYWLDYVMPYEFKIRITQKMTDIVFTSGKQIVNAYYIISVSNKSVTQV